MQQYGGFFETVVFQASLKCLSIASLLLTLQWEEGCSLHNFVHLGANLLCVDRFGKLCGF